MCLSASSTAKYSDMLAPSYTGYISVITVLYWSQCWQHMTLLLNTVLSLSSSYSKVFRLIEEPLPVNVVFGVKKKKKSCNKVMSHAQFKPTGGIPFPTAAISHTN